VAKLEIASVVTVSDGTDLTSSDINGFVIVLAYSSIVPSDSKIV